MSSALALLAWVFSSTQPALAADSAPGRSTYVAKCQACHGATGRGDGPAAAALPKPPRSFATAEFWAGLTNEKLGATIASGKPGTAMRGFPMESGQMADLIAYLRGFQPKPQ
jgi:mono/diheme cytochrome c family protein